MTDTPATPVRDLVDQIWDMRAELWADESYDALDQVITDAYAAGRDEERKRLRAGVTEALGAFRSDLVYTAPEDWHMRIQQLENRLARVLDGSDG